MAEAVITATRPSNNNRIKRVYSFEVLSSTEWSFGSFGSFQPTFFVEISDGDLEKKLLAMTEYGSEIRSVPHPRSLQIIRSLAEMRGSSIGVKYAEAFVQLRAVSALGIE
jgi:hypothetical protein